MTTTFKHKKHFKFSQKIGSGQILPTQKVEYKTSELMKVLRFFVYKENFNFVKKLNYAKKLL